MTIPHASLSRWFRIALIAVSACGLSLASVSAAETMKQSAEKKLPLKASFEKVENAEAGPFVLTLKNEAKEAIKASAKVLLAVAYHADSKARNVPEQTIEPGKTMTIRDLAAEDKVIVTAKGYAPLEVVVK